MGMVEAEADVILVVSEGGHTRLGLVVPDFHQAEAVEEKRREETRGASKRDEEDGKGNEPIISTRNKMRFVQPGIEGRKV
jgi:hypothetical protein